MANDKKLRVLNSGAFNPLETKLSFVRVSFPDDRNPIFLIWDKIIPSNDDVLGFLKNELIVDVTNGYTLTWKVKE